MATADRSGGIAKEAIAVPPLRVLPGADLPRRYAGVSTDHNPIHLDEKAAHAAGLPAPVLHGLYTMALVARCACNAGDGRQLRRLAVGFRAPGFPSEEVEVSGAVEEVSSDGMSLRLVARQGRRRLIRDARAELGPLTRRHPGDPESCDARTARARWNDSGEQANNDPWEA